MRPNRAYEAASGAFGGHQARVHGWIRPCKETQGNVLILRLTLHPQILAPHLLQMHVVC